jgi:hypothetical protein
MGQDAHRARQAEQAARQRRRKAELGVDHRGRAVDVHRNSPPCLARRQLVLDRAGDGGETATDLAGLGRFVGQLEQTRRTRVDRVEAVTEAGHEPAVAGDRLVQPGTHRIEHHLAGVDAGGDGLQHLDRLLAGAAVHVPEHVDRRRDGVVQADAAGGGHACDRDARRLRAMVHRRHQRRVEQAALARGRQLAARHQPDHLHEADTADQLLDRITAVADASGLHVDDGRAPPVAELRVVHGAALWSTFAPEGLRYERLGAARRAHWSTFAPRGSGMSAWERPGALMSRSPGPGRRPRAGRSPVRRGSRPCVPPAAAAAWRPRAPGRRA